jgi:hypothetical protein
MKIRNNGDVEILLVQGTCRAGNEAASWARSDPLTVATRRARPAVAASRPSSRAPPSPRSPSPPTKLWHGLTVIRRDDRRSAAAFWHPGKASAADVVWWTVRAGVDNDLF